MIQWIANVHWRWFTHMKEVNEGWRRWKHGLCRDLVAEFGGLEIHVRHLVLHGRVSPQHEE